MMSMQKYVAHNHDETFDQFQLHDHMPTIHAAPEIDPGVGVTSILVLVMTLAIVRAKVRS